MVVRMDIKKLALMTTFGLILLSGSALADDINASVTVSNIPTVGLFSVGLFATIMGAGFLLTIIKLLYVDTTGREYIDAFISIVIMALILGSAIGILFSL
jgi:hypothetical protein